MHCLQPNRRDFLYGLSVSLGTAALNSLLQAEEKSAAPLAARPQHHGAKAKSCIFLFMEGGVSQMDTFEYKPELIKYAGKQMPKADRTVGEVATFSAAPNRIIPPYWSFKQYGQTGRWVSDLLPNLATQID